ncbi:hypothetical protein ElyMa_004778100 [Elysia marginata]|uniref:Uncharacterized protein n=1 Tax=Elysia marginata TaxID=1093978 RepID=A0AAV4IHX3_9GAST|nr:hypothetical protein ElyMa_004778100 [Elysia marginata]
MLLEATFLTQSILRLKDSDDRQCPGETDLAASKPRPMVATKQSSEPSPLRLDLGFARLSSPLPFPHNVLAGLSVSHQGAVRTRINHPVLVVNQTASSAEQCPFPTHPWQASPPKRDKQ